MAKRKRKAQPKTEMTKEQREIYNKTAPRATGLSLACFVFLWVLRVSVITSLGIAVIFWLLYIGIHLSPTYRKKQPYKGHEETPLDAAEKESPTVLVSGSDITITAGPYTASLTPKIIFDGYEDDEDVPSENIPKFAKAPSEITNLKKLRNYVVVDTETTGLNRKTDEMVEIAILTVENGKLSEEYSTLICPKVPISAAASAVNGITGAELAGAPTLDDVLPEITSRLSGKTIIGHNVTFDLAFIARAFAGPDAPDYLYYIDTLTLSKNCVQAESHKLQNLAAQLNLDPGQAHRALADARTTLQLYQYCVKKMDADAAEARQRKKEEHERRVVEFAWSPLNDKNFVFTGDLSIYRDEQERYVNRVGANRKTGVSGRTNYIVIGDYSDYKEHHSVPYELYKANQRIEKGQNIIKLSEAEFFDLIESTEKLKPTENKQ